MAPAEEDPLVGTVVDGRYRILSRIAAGGMGVIYRAEQVFLKHQVALKRLHRELTGHGQAMVRFQREAQAAVKIDHPNVCRVLDCGVGADGSLFVAMELLEGQSLAQRIADYAPLPLSEIADVGAQICAGLDRAHALGIVHRDLKPENVMLVPLADGSAVTAKIMDFGVAKVTYDVDGKALTQAGMVFGTPKYMAPEQASGEALDARADLYSVGVMLFEMATGRTPFDAPTMSAMLTKHLTEPPPTLEAAAPHLSYPLPFREIVARCLVKDPRNRIATAEALGEALRGCAGQRASLVGPPKPRVPRDDLPTVLAGTEVKTPLYVPGLPTTGFEPLPLTGATTPVRRRPGWRVFAAAGGALAVVAVIVIAAISGGNGAGDGQAPGATGEATVAVTDPDVRGDESVTPSPWLHAGRSDVAAMQPGDAGTSPGGDAGGEDGRPETVVGADAPSGSGPTREELAAAIAEERRVFEAGQPRVLEAVAQAATGGTRQALEKLRALAADLEANAHYHYELAVLLIGEAQPREAIQHALRAVIIDPRYGAEPGLVSVAERGLVERESGEAAAALLERIVDEALAERVVRYVLERTRSLRTLGRARELLERRGLLEGLPEWLRLPLLVMTTEECQACRAVLAEVAARPDARMFSFLRHFRSETGCGPGGRRDCWPCERSALREALAAVEAAGATDGPSADAGSGG